MGKILEDIKPKIDIAPYTFLSDQAQVTARFNGRALTVNTKNPFVMGMINTPAVKEALKEAAAEVMKKPVAVRIVRAEENSSNGSSKLDALTERFPGVIKIE